MSLLSAVWHSKYHQMCRMCNVCKVKYALVARKACCCPSRMHVQNFVNLHHMCQGMQGHVEPSASLVAFAIGTVS